MVAPFWSNTQVLWYRKSFVDKAGIDMSKPVTWDQIIDAAAENGGTVAVQSNKYEGYVVWINALISGAGGEIAHRHHQGPRHAKLDDQLPGRREGGRGHREARPLLRRARGHVGRPRGHSRCSTFASPQGAFMVNWTYIYNNYEATDPGSTRTSATRATRRPSQGEPSRPPYGGIGIGVSKSTPTTSDDAMKALECLTSPENQGVNAELTGNMPARPPATRTRNAPEDLPRTAC